MLILNQNNIPYFETWEGQKELEKIVNDRVLNRPKTSYIFITFFSFLLVLLLIFFILFIVLNEIRLIMNIIYSIIFIIIYFELLIRIFLIKLIECYQHYAKESTRRKCLCIPSCSEYSIIVLKKYFLIKALLKIRKRLFVTCNGEMYLIDNP